MNTLQTKYLISSADVSPPAADVVPERHVGGAGVHHALQLPARLQPAALLQGAAALLPDAAIHHPQENCQVCHAITQSNFIQY